MTLGNRQDPCRQEKVHYKMYKDGKRWVVAGLFSVFIATGLLTQPVQAATSTTATTSTDQVAQSQADSAAALQAKAVALKTSSEAASSAAAKSSAAASSAAKASSEAAKKSAAAKSSTAASSAAKASSEAARKSAAAKSSAAASSAAKASSEAARKSAAAKSSTAASSATTASSAVTQKSSTTTASAAVAKVSAASTVTQSTASAANSTASKTGTYNDSRVASTATTSATDSVASALAQTTSSAAASSAANSTNEVTSVSAEAGTTTTTQALIEPTNAEIDTAKTIAEINYRLTQQTQEITMVSGASASDGATTDPEVATDTKLSTTYSDGTNTYDQYQAADGVIYHVADGEAWVDGYTGSATDLVIAGMYGTGWTAGISAGAFQNNTTLKTVTADSVAHIGESAFSGDTALTAYKSANLDTATSYAIDANAFSGDTALVQVGKYTTLTDLMTVQNVTESAFSGSPFSGATVSDTATGTVYTDGTTTYDQYQAADGVIYHIQDGTAYVDGMAADGSALSSDGSTLTLAESYGGANAEVITANAFANNATLTTVDFADSYWEILDSAFSGDTSLTTINLENIKVFGAEAFKDDAALATVTLNAAATVNSTAFTGTQVNTSSDQVKGDYTGTDGKTYTQYVASDGLLYHLDSNGGLYIDGYSGTGSAVNNGTLTIGANYAGTYVSGVTSKAFASLDLTAVTLPSSVWNMATDAFQNVGNITFSEENATVDFTASGDQYNMAYTFSDPTDLIKKLGYTNFKIDTIAIDGAFSAIWASNNVFQTNGASNMVTDTENAVMTVSFELVPYQVVTLKLNVTLSQQVLDTTHKVVYFEPETGATSVSLQGPIIIDSSIQLSKDNAATNGVPTTITDADGNTWTLTNVTSATDGWNALYHEDSDFTYTTDTTTQSTTITGYTGTATDLTLPTTLDGYTVTAVADNAFNNKGITSVTFPATTQIQTLGTNSFSNNPQLTTVTLPASVWDVGESAFANDGLTSLDFAEGSAISVIDKNAFSGNQLTTITVPGQTDKAVTINPSAFANQTTPTTATIDMNKSAVPDQNNTTANVLEKFGTALQAALTAAGSTIQLADVDTNMAINKVDSDGTYATGDSAYWYYDTTTGNLKLPQANQDLSGQFTLNIMFTLGTNGANGYQIINVPVDIQGENNTVNFTANSADSGNYIQDAQTIVSNDLATDFSNMSDYQILHRDSDDTYWQYSSLTKNSEGDYTAVYNQLTDFTFDTSSGTITGYTGALTAYLNQQNGTTASTELVIPDTINGIAVGIIGSNAFANVTGFTTLTLGANVWNVSDSAFKGLGLNEVNLDANLSTIGDNAFSNNQLTTLTVPSKVVTIGTNAFSDNNLAILTFAADSTLSVIGDSAFANNKQLTSLTLPNTLAKVNGQAGKITIGTGAFQNDGLVSLDLGSTINVIGANAFQGNVIEGTVTIPAGTTEIGECAFADNAISTVILPAGVVTDESAFNDNLIDTITTGTTLDQIDKAGTTFREQFKTEPITIDTTITAGTDGTLASFWKTLSENSTIQQMVSSFPYYFTNQQTNEVDISGAKFELSNDDTEKGWYYDYLTDTLQSTSMITSGDYTMEVVTYNGYGFFVKLHVNVAGKLVKYKVSNMTTSVGTDFGGYSVEKTTYVASDLAVNSKAYLDALSQAYKEGSWDTSSAENILKTADGHYYQFDHLEASKTNAGTYTAIYNELSNFSFTEAINEDGTFAGYTVTGYTGDLDKYLVSVGESPVSSATNLEIPETYNGANVIEIGDNAFANQGITSVTIPNSVWGIGDYAFEGNKLTAINLPSSITVIGAFAFADNQLTAVSFPNAVTLGDSAFFNNQITTQGLDLTGVTFIGGYAFANNKLTGTLVIPSSVETIGNTAFVGTHYHGVNVAAPTGNDLSAVDFSQATNLKTIADGAFMSNSLQTLTIPSNVTLINVNAFADNALISVNLSDANLVLGSGVFDGNEISSVTGYANTTYNTGTAATGTFAQQFVDPTSLTVDAKVLSGYAIENFKQALVTALEKELSDNNIDIPVATADAIIAEVESKTATLTIDDGNNGVWDYDPSTDNLTIPANSKYEADANGVYELTYNTGESSTDGKITVSLNIQDSAAVNTDGASTDPEYGVVNLVLNLSPDLTHRTALVTYVDDDTLDATGDPTTVKRAVLSSDTDADTLDYTATIPDGYLYVPDTEGTVNDDGTIAYQVEMSNDGSGNITIHLVHHHTYTTQQGTRIIDYMNANGKVMTNTDGSTVKAIMQHVNYSVDTDDVTGKWIATLENNADGSTGYAESDSPVIDGYVADQTTVPASTVPVQITSGSLQAATMQIVTVTYTPVSADNVSATITYVDDSGSLETATLPAAATITGAPGQTGTYTLSIPEGMTLVDVTNEAGDTISTNGNKVNYTLTSDTSDNLMVHLTKATTYTVTAHYVDEAGTQIADDQVLTGYLTGAGYSVATPLINGYLYDHEQQNTDGSTTALTGTITDTNVAITLVYRNDPSINTSATISFVDTDGADADGKYPVVSSKTVSGKKGTSEQLTISVPTGYLLATDQLDHSNWTDNQDGTITYTSTLVSDNSDDAVIYLAHDYAKTTPGVGEDGYDETHKTLTITVTVTKPDTLTDDVTPTNATQTLAYTRTQTVDKTDPDAAVTYGDWTLVPNTGLSDIAITAADGYTVTATDQDDQTTFETSSGTIAASDVANTGTYTHFMKTDTVGDSAIAIALVYVATDSYLNIIYVDQDEDDTQVGKVSKKGKTGEKGTSDVTSEDSGINWTTYKLAPGQSESVDYTFAASDDTSDNVTVYLVHQHATQTDALETTQTVTYTGASKVDMPADNSQTIKWDTDTDLVTTNVLYTPESTYTAVDVPTISGYTSAITEGDVTLTSISATTLAAQTDTPVNTAITVTYIGEPADLTITYVDTDQANAQVGAVVTETGITGETAPYTVTIPDGYVLADGQAATVDYTFAANDDTSDNLEIRLAHAHSAVTQTVTYTVNYTVNGQAISDATATKLGLTSVVQLANFNGDQDDSTGEITWTPAADAAITAVQSPTVLGYTADQTEATWSLAAGLTEGQPQNVTQTINYTANTDTTAEVVFVDDAANGAVVTSHEITGTTDTVPTTGTTFTIPGGYQLAATQPDTAKYTVAGDTITYRGTLSGDDSDNATIHLTHHHTATTVTTTRTIHYQGAGNQTPTTTVQTVTWQVDQDDTTGTSTYTPTTNYAAVAVKAIAGYTDTIQTATGEALTAITASDLKATTTQPGDTDINVTYKPVTYHPGDTVPAELNLTLTKTVMVNTVYTQPSTGEATSQTVVFYRTGSVNPKDSENPIYSDWTTDVSGTSKSADNLSTTVAALTTLQTPTGYTGAVTIDGAVGNQAITVANTEANGTVINRVVTYTADQQKAIVTYQDDTTGKTLGEPVVLTGVSDGQSDYTTAATIAAYTKQGYELVSDDFPTAGLTFDTADDATQTFEVHFKHGTTTVTPTDPGDYSAELTHVVQQTVNFEFEDGTTAAPTVTDSVTFTRTGTIDNVTKTIGYTDWQAKNNDTTFNAVSAPNIAGYTANSAAIAQVTGITADTADMVKTITYKANQQTVQVLYKDTITGTILTTATVTGDSNTAVNYSTAQQIATYETQGYTLVKDGYPTNGLLFDTDDDATQTFEVDLQHGTTTVTPDDPGDYSAELTHTVNETVYFEFKGGTAAAPTVTDSVTFIRTGTIDNVTKTISYTDWQAENNDTTFDAVSAPAVAGYTAGSDASLAVENITATTADVTQTILYTADQQTATITYVDDTTNTDLATDNIKGATATQSDYRTAQAIATYEQQGYVLVSDGFPVDFTFDADDTVTQKFEVHLQHGTTTVTPDDPETPGDSIDPNNPTGPTWPAGSGQTDLNRTVTETIHYVYADGKQTTAQPDVTDQVSFTRSATVDNVTGDLLSQTAWIATDSDDTFDEKVTLPLTGYTASDASIAAMTVTATTPNVEKTVTYTPITYTPTDDVPAELNLTLEKTVTVKTTYDAPSTVSATTATVTFYRTGSVDPDDPDHPTYSTWTTDASGTSQSSADLTATVNALTNLQAPAGYTGRVTISGKEGNDTISIANSTAANTVINREVSYTGNATTKAIEYLDIATGQIVTVANTPTISGKTGDSGTYTVNTADLPANYELATGQATSVAYTLAATNDPMVIEIQPELQYSTKTITRTITFSSDETQLALPAQIRQVVHFKVVTNKVTGATVATPEGSYQAYTPDSIAGYSISVNGTSATSVAAQGFEATTDLDALTDSTVDVHYTAGSVNITTAYVDEQGHELANAPTVSTTGKVGTTYQTSAKNVTGYLLDTTQTPANATGIVSADPITVTYVYKQLGAYQITPPNGGTTTTITYPNDPSDPEQVGTPTTATGVVPNEPGYTPVGPDGEALTPVDPDDPSQGYTLPNVPTDPTQNTVITYRANQQTATVTYIDDTTGETLGESVVLMGTSNSQSSYTTAATIATYEGQGYQLVSDDFPIAGLTFDTDDSVTQTFDVHLKHGTTTVTTGQPDQTQLAKTVTETVHYQYADGTTAHTDETDQIHFTRAATVDTVTGKVLSVTAWQADQTTFDQKVSPIITGYVASVDAIAAITNVTPDTQAIDKTVTYTQLGAYQITPPNGGETTTITYPNDPDNPTDAGTPTTATGVVPNEPGYTPVGPDGEDLTPVDPDDPSQGYHLPDIPADPTQDTAITYRANTDTAQVVYFDDTTKTWLATDRLTGKTATQSDYDPAAKIAAFEAQGYTLVSDNYPTTGITFSAENQIYSVHLKHNLAAVTTDLNKAVTETIHYQYADGTVAANEVTDQVVFTRTGVTDQVTGVTTYTPWQATDNDTTFAAVKSPSITGYVADKAVIAEVDDITAETQNRNVTVSYAKMGAYQITPPNGGQTTTITYPNDPDNPDQAGTPTTTTGVVPNEPGYTPVGPDGKDLTPVDPDDPSKGYELPHVPSDPTQDTTITYVANDQTITTNYVDEKGQTIAPSTSQTVKTDERYSTTPAVINGYILDDTKLPSNASGTANGVITVTYVYKQLGSYQITPPNDGQEIDITYPNDPTNPDKTGDNTKVVPNEPGYTPVGPDGKALTPVDPDDPSKGYELPHVPSDPTQDTTITYVANDQTVTTNYVDEKGQTIASSTSQTVKTGEQYSTTPAIVDGYILDGTKLPSNASGTATNAVTVTYIYKQLGSYQITPPNGGKTTTITYPNDPDDPDKVGTPTTKTGVVPNKPGYTPVGPDGKALTPVDPDDPSKGYELPHVPGDPTQNTTITYVANDVTVTTDFVDKKGQTVAPSTSQTVKTGEQYSTTPAVVSGYILTGTPTNASGTAKGSVTVIYTYKQLGSYQITPPNDGQEIDITYPNDPEDPNKTGDNTKVVPNEPGYTPVGPDGKDLTPVDPDDPSKGYELPHVPDDPTQNTTITYVANDQTITTNYVDEKGQTVASSTSQTVKTGEKYSTTPAVVSGYILDGTKLPNNANGTATSAVTVTYVYKQLGSYQITPPNNGQEIDITYPNDPEDPNKTGDNTKVVPNEPGYTPVGPDGKDLTPVDPDDPSKGYELLHVPDDPTQNTTITYVANDVTITTNFVDEKGQTIASSTSQKTKTGEKYNTTPAVVSGYILTGIPANASGTANGSITVTYVYKKLGSYQITPPNNGQEIDITYPNDPEDPNKTGNNTKVVPNEPGYTPVGPDGKDLTPVNPNDPSKGYELPHVPSDPSQSIKITYRQITPKTPSQSGTTTTVPGQPADTATVPTTSGATTPVTAPITGRSASTPSSETVAAKGQQPAGAPATTKQAVGQKTLPQTSEQTSFESSVLGLGLLTAALSWFGLKRKRHEK